MGLAMIYNRGINKIFCSKFLVSCQVWQETSKEDRILVNIEMKTIVRIIRLYLQNVDKLVMFLIAWDRKRH